MTEKPYTDADVELAHRAFDAAWSTHNETHPERHCAALDMAEEECCDRAGLVAALDALAAGGRLVVTAPGPTDEQVRAGADALVRLRTQAPSLSELAKDEQECWLADARAVLEAAGPLTTPGRCGNLAPSISLLVDPVRATCSLTAGHAGWHRAEDGGEWIEHGTEPVDASLVQQMLDDATRAFADASTASERVEVIRDLLAGWYAAWPASAVTDEHEGIAHQIVALVNAAEARAAECPCLPGAPEHRHGVGGYSTSGERAAEAHHVIAFAGDGTWSLEHPATCPPRDDASATDWDCPLRQLAERQIPSDLAALMAGGRYTCHAGDVGDLFQLGDRLHDDQCTTPVCAACGCWCHAEEQTEG